MIRLLVVLFVLLMSTPAWADVAIHTRASATATGTSPITISFNNNSVSPLIVSCHWRINQTLSTVTYDSVAMTLLANPTGVGDDRHAVYLLKTPTTGIHNVVATWSTNPTAATCFVISTTGGDTVSAVRTVYTRRSVDGTGPGLTVVDSQAGDIVFHAATVSPATITFDAPEVTTSTEDDAIFGGVGSGGLSTQTASGANTVVGCTDAASYTESAFALFAPSVARSNAGAMGGIIF